MDLEFPAVARGGRHQPGSDYVEVVSLWCPWWLAVAEYAPGNSFNLQHVSKPLVHEEYLALPAELQ